MSRLHGSRPQGSYGIDAPYVPIAFVAAAVAAVLLSLVGGSVPVWLGIAAFFVLLAAIYLHTSVSGKFAVWRRLIDGEHLRGDERAVDIGCGRGAVTVLLARHLPRGQVDGVDLWRSVDQSGNDVSHAQANLVANDVADRVELHTADMRDLPFADGSVDLVTASFAIHNLKEPQERAAAVAAAYRILKPGGRLLIADISNVRDYAATLTELGAAQLQTRNAGVNGWWSAPWMATTTLTATKP